MSENESRPWAIIAAVASVAAALAIPVGIQFGTAAFCMATGPIAAVAGFRAYCEAISRKHPRDEIPALFAIFIGCWGTFFLFFGIFRWLQSGVFPTH